MSDVTRHRGRLLATAALRPDALRATRVEPPRTVDVYERRAVISGQPLDSEADTRLDHNRNPVCDACGGRLYHRSQVRCPWVCCRAWLKGSRNG